MEGTLVAVHAPLEGRDKTRVDPVHRRPLTRSHRRASAGDLQRDTRNGNNSLYLTPMGAGVESRIEGQKARRVIS
jgi:hypothetical protein